MAFTFSGCSREAPEKFPEDYRVTDLRDGTRRVVGYMAMDKRGGDRWSDALTRPIMPESR